MRQITYVVILLFIIPYSVYSQSIPDIEKLLETNDIDSSENYYEDMINSLIRLSAQPINLNSAGFDSLKMLFFLSDAQIDNLLNFLKNTGRLLTRTNFYSSPESVSRIYPTSNHLYASECTPPKSNPVITYRKKFSPA